MVMDVVPWSISLIKTLLGRIVIREMSLRRSAGLSFERDETSTESAEDSHPVEPERESSSYSSECYHLAPESQQLRQAAAPQRSRSRSRESFPDTQPLATSLDSTTEAGEQATVGDIAGQAADGDISGQARVVAATVALVTGLEQAVASATAALATALGKEQAARDCIGRRLTSLQSLDRQPPWSVAGAISLDESQVMTESQVIPLVRAPQICVSGSSIETIEDSPTTQDAL